MDKGRFTPVSNNGNGGIFNFFASLKSLSDFHVSMEKKIRDGILAWWLSLHRSFKFRYHVFVVGCHVSSCLLEPLKFQPLLCRGIPLFEASFLCQCFVQDGE